METRLPFNRAEEVVFLSTPFKICFYYKDMVESSLITYSISGHDLADKTYPKFHFLTQLQLFVSYWAALPVSSFVHWSHHFLPHTDFFGFIRNQSTHTDATCVTVQHNPTIAKHLQSITYQMSSYT